MPERPSGTVTFLFTDLEGSTQLWERHPEAMRSSVARHDSLLRESVAAHGGRIFKTGGDSFSVVFQRAPDAVAAAVAAQLALGTETWGEPGPLRARIALHSGSADERDGDYFGPALNRAARLLAIGHGGQILLSLSTAVLVRDALPAGTALRDMGRHRLKDLQQPEQVFQLVHAGLADEFPPLRSLESFPNNLPLQPTSFIGRERELAELRRLLSASRLLTLTGPGGSGKTRLALQLAAELLESYPDGVWLVDLAALTDPALVSQTVASALGVREVPGRSLTQTISESLKPRRLLIVLDNCEHVVEACAQLAAALMRSCPDVTLLTTSREALGTSGELVWPVPSLATPDPRRLGSVALSARATLTQYESVRLFVDRAALAKPDFAVTNQNAPAVAQICHRLDGIPLALELAAGRVKVLTVEQIAARLDDRFRLLTGGSRTALPRHQTLRAAIDWSYELLPERERTLLRRVSVFAGGWMLEAAEAVCGDEEIENWELLELQSHLVDKSLVMAETGAGGDARYRLLGTIRRYAGDRLLESGEAGRLRACHRDWFLELAERAALELRGPDQAQWLDRLEQEHDNLRAALEWSLAEESGVESALRLAGALFRFWYWRGYLSEGSQWLDAALSRSSGAAAGPHAKALRGAGVLALEQGDFERARVLLDQALSLYRDLDDKRGLARALLARGGVDLYQSEYERGALALEEALGLAREIAAWDIVGTLLNNLGEVARSRGDDQAARLYYQEALEATGESPEPHGRMIALFNLGQVALGQGDSRAARSFFLESLDASTKLGNRSMVPCALEGLAGVCMLQDLPQRAARLLGAAGALRKVNNLPMQAVDKTLYNRTVAAARAKLTEPDFGAAWGEGSRMDQEQAVAYALEDTGERAVDSLAIDGRSPTSRH